ncbi:FKBP-type peptidyl-prolyl cis-trans isomerase [Fibrobacterota bacterium]
MKKYLIVSILAALLLPFACSKKEDTAAKQELDDLKQSAAYKEAKAKEDEGAFLTANKAKEGVMTTASGLQYMVLQMGEGNKPTPRDSVLVNLTGTLANGAEFEKLQNASLSMNGMVPGLAEALQLMGAGSKYKVFVPSSLAYGEKGDGGKISPYSTLVFEIELLKIIKPPPVVKKKPGMTTEHKIQKAKKLKKLEMKKKKAAAQE